MPEGDLKIRELKRKDRRVLGDLIRKLTDKIGSNELLKVMVSDSLRAGKAGEKETGRENDFSRLGIEMVKLMLEVIEDDVSRWFADLLGVSPQEYDELPFDTELRVLEQLCDAEEINRFFSSALRLSSRMKKLAAGLRQPRTA